MRELDHDNESRFDCDLCQESGIGIESREYCSCELGKRRMNLDRLAEPLRNHPFTDAMWVAHHSAIKSERAIAAADKALLVDRAQRAEAAKLNAEGRVRELERRVAELRAAAPSQPVVLSDEKRNAIAMDAVRIFADLLNSELFDEPKDKAARSDIRSMAKNFKPAYWNVGQAILAAKEQA